MSRKKETVNCREFEKNVMALLEHALPRGIEESLEEHRTDCQSCAALAVTIEKILREEFSGSDTALSERFWPALLERVRESERQDLAFKWQALRPIALTACFLFALWAGVHLGNAVVNQTMASPAETEIVPYLSVLDEVPHDSLTELLLQESFQIEMEQ